MMKNNLDESKQGKVLLLVGIGVAKGSEASREFSWVVLLVPNDCSVVLLQ